MSMNVNQKCVLQIRYEHQENLVRAVVQNGGTVSRTTVC